MSPAGGRLGRKTFAAGLGWRSVNGAGEGEEETRLGDWESQLIVTNRRASWWRKVILVFGLLILRCRRKYPVSGGSMYLVLLQMREEWSETRYQRE